MATRSFRGIANARLRCAVDNILSHPSRWKILRPTVIELALVASGIALAAVGICLALGAALAAAFTTIA